MSTISVIVPVYNVEPYLHRCIDSILSQTYTDFELVLVDDGSPDNCGTICDECAAKDSRIHVIHQANGGLSAARNVGIDWSFANSNSSWIYFADSDDWIHPKSLEVLLNGAEQTGMSVVVGGFGYTGGESPAVDETALAAKVWKTEDYFCKHNVNAVVAWGKLYRKESFCTIRYPVGKTREDEFTTYKVLFESEKVAVIDQPLYAYFQNPNGIVGGEWKPIRLDVIEALEERADYFQKRGNEKMYRTSLVYLIGTHLLEARNLKKADNPYQAEYLPLIRKSMKEKVAQYRKELTISEYILACQILSRKIFRFADRKQR